jgi:phosphate butyryltransferase
MDFDSVLNLAGEQSGRRLIVAGQNDPNAVAAVLKARDRGWVDPVAAGQSLADLSGDMDVRFKDADIRTARMRSLERAGKGAADLYMDLGPLDTDFFTLLREWSRETIRGGILSYVSMLHIPKEGRLTLLTDTMVNPAPGLEEKIHILENVTHVAGVLGMNEPKIAALAPLELVNPTIPSTVEAAVLSKMSERGQFQTAVIEGPLGLDNAESGLAAKQKGIDSPVPGNVDVYLFPDMESAQHTTQFLVWLGQCRAGGILAGTPFPVIIRSPLEPVDSWMTNLALGLVLLNAIPCSK